MNGMLLKFFVAVLSSLSLLEWSVCFAAEDRLRIGAFNVQVFGTAKLQRPGVLPILVDIVRRYDIILIQEIRDISGSAIQQLLCAVNSCEMDTPPTYNLTISERLGRTNSKEQYAFLYRMSTVEILSTYQFEDPMDVFQREPYTVHFRSKINGIPDFFLTGLHAEPDSTNTSLELNALVHVYGNSTVQFQNINGVLLGDFNADCTYLSNAKYSRLDLVNDPRFTWLLNEDTTTTSTVCAYDRIITAGAINDFLVNQSALVFKFDSAYNLSSELTLNVSDHYPVEFQLQAVTQTNLQTTTTLDSVDTTVTDNSALRNSLSISALLFTFVAFISIESVWDYLFDSLIN